MRFLLWQIKGQITHDGRIRADTIVAMATGALHQIAKAIRPFLPAFLWNFVRAAATAFATPLRFSTRTGHFRSSLAGRAVAADGSPLPWYTYPAIDFLAARDYAGRSVLEFGGGQSTLWWQKRARSVVTFESDPTWEAKLTRQVQSNVSIHHMPIELPDDQCLAQMKRAIDGRKFDVIVVDGHMRCELTDIAFHHLAPGGAIVLDDSEGYLLYEEIRGRDCRRIDFFGFAPGSVRRHCTSVVYVVDCFLLRPEIGIQTLDL